MVRGGAYRSVEVRSNDAHGRWLQCMRFRGPPSIWGLAISALSAPGQDADFLVPEGFRVTRAAVGGPSFLACCLDESSVGATERRQDLDHTHAAEAPGALNRVPLARHRLSSDAR